MLKTPEFEIKTEKNDTTMLIRIHQLQNGYLLRTKDKPIHYQNLEQLTKALSAGVHQTFNGHPNHQKANQCNT